MKSKDTQKPSLTLVNMEGTDSHTIYFISESIATIDFGNLVDENINKKVISLFHQLSASPLPGMVEVIPAYSSLSVCFNLREVRKKIHPSIDLVDWMRRELEWVLASATMISESPSRLVRIPVCYDEEFGIDLRWVATKANLSIEKLIQLHASRQYRVYMLGFLPGFAYMGQVANELDVPRKEQPQPVLEGSVGIVGKQTGIYPVNSPGGWRILGRTPMRMFNCDADEQCLLKAGDTVEFYSITKNEFENH